MKSILMTEKPERTFDREGFQEMMYAIYNGKVNCIIVKDLSRFGREYIEMGDYVEKDIPIARCQIYCNK